VTPAVVVLTTGIGVGDGVDTVVVKGVGDGVGACVAGGA